MKKDGLTLFAIDSQKIAQDYCVNFSLFKFINKIIEIRIIILNLFALQKMQMSSSDPLKYNIKVEKKRDIAFKFQ